MLGNLSFLVGYAITMPFVFCMWHDVWMDPALKLASYVFAVTDHHPMYLL